MPSAEGGTLFLDEVADLPLHMQVKLLRVTQEKTVRPIGERRESPIDVRIVSATHKNLAELVAEAKFCEDLYYRINVIEIRVPPLRERREDIRPLAEAILGRLEKHIGISGMNLSAEAWHARRSCEYPGNVRELENVLERAATLSGSGAIEVEHIRLRAAPRPAGCSAHVRGGRGTRRSFRRAQRPVGARDTIMKALEQSRYNKTAAAKLLSLSYRALRYKIQKLGIE